MEGTGIRSTVSRLLGLFTRRERWRLLGLFGAVLGMAFIETFSVASIMPFMAVAGDPSMIERNRWLARLYELSGAADPLQFLFFLGLGVLVVLVLSNLFSAATLWWMLRFVWRKVHDLSLRVLRRYLSRPYVFFLDRNTAELSKNILSEVMVVATGMLVPALNVVVRGTVSVALFALLFVIDPLLALLSVAVLGGAYGVLYLFVRDRQARYGRTRTDANTMRFRLSGEALVGVKDVKALGREREFLARFAAPSEVYAWETAKHEMIGQLPRYAVGTVAFGGILLIVLVVLRSGEGLGTALPVLGAYGFAGYKLMPALQLVFEGLSRIRFYEPVLDDLYRDLGGAVEEEDDDPVSGGWPAAAGAGVATAEAAAGREDAAPPSFRTTLRGESLAYTYPGADRPSLRDVTVEIGRGAMVALVGPTGSGKTTLVDLLAGLLEPDAGRILVDGEPLERRRRWRERIGYVAQEIFLLDDTVEQNIAFGLPDERVDAGRVEWAARVAQLHEFVDGLPDRYGTVVGERGVRLSGGQRQRIGIARALYGRPDLLLLDEGTSALDGETEARFVEALRALEPLPTVVWVAHRLATVRECDAIYLLEDGRVSARGTYDELMAASERFRAMARGEGEELAVAEGGPERGSREAFLEVLSRVPSDPPSPGDELPEELKEEDEEA